MPIEVEHINPEATVLENVKAGDQSAFEKLYWTYSERIYKRLLHLLKDGDVADSILQDVFLRVWERREQIDPKQSFKAFLYKIAENLVYDYFRKLARDKRLQVKLRGITTELFNQTEENIFRKENAALIDEAIEKLPPQRKMVFKLCRLEGKSYDEAAKLLNISVSTVSNQLVKGTRSVKEHVLIANGTGLVLILLAIGL